MGKLLCFACFLHGWLPATLLDSKHYGEDTTTGGTGIDPVHTYCACLLYHRLQKQAAVALNFSAAAAASCAHTHAAFPYAATIIRVTVTSNETTICCLRKTADLAYYILTDR